MRKQILSRACGLAAIVVLGLGAAQAGPRGAPGQTSTAPTAASEQFGVASWYGEDHDGRVTASGERFDMYGLTAAYAALPFNSVVEVTNMDNGRRVDLRVIDRPAPGKADVIVVSKAAAANLGFSHALSAPVRVRLVGTQQQAALPAAASQWR